MAKPFLYALALAFLMAGLHAPTASAQDDEYKKVYNEALAAAKAKNYTDAYSKYEQAATLAKKAGDQEVVRSSLKVLGQLDYLMGKQLVDKEQYSQALARFDKGIEHLTGTPFYEHLINNYVGKALALKKLDRPDEAIEAYVALVNVGKENNSQIAVQKGEEGIRGHYHYLASQTLARNSEPSATDAREALGYLEEMEKYVDADQDTHYYTAVANYALGNYDTAIQEADQALEMHHGSKTDKAKIYFVKGESLMLKGDIPSAKEAFVNAKFGPWKNRAEHYLETL